MRIVVMGVSACGKSTVAELLASELEVPYVDGDKFHPPGNVAKLKHDVPLTDADRLPWLQTLSEILSDHPNGVVMACSSLKKYYRDILREKSLGLKFLYLEITRVAAIDRLISRAQNEPDHVLKDFEKTIVGQFEALEDPSEEAGVIRVSALLVPVDIVQFVTEVLRES